MSVSDAFTAEALMSPSREDKSVDASRLSFNFQTVAIIVSTALLMSGLQYITGASERNARDEDRKIQAQMQSDIRDMRTRMENQTEVHKLEKELLDAQLAAMKAAIDASGLRTSAMALSQELQKAQKER